MNLEPVKRDGPSALERLEANLQDQQDALATEWTTQSAASAAIIKLTWLILLAAAIVLVATMVAGGAGWLRNAAVVVLLGIAYLAWQLRGKQLVSTSDLQRFDHLKVELDQLVRKRTAELTMAFEALKDETLERQWAGQALEHQLRYAQLIINAFGDGVFVVTRTLKITRLNPATLHLTGYAEPELVGGPLAKVLRLAFSGQEEILMKADPVEIALKENRELPERSAFLLGKGGKILPATVRVFPLRDHDKVVGAVIVTRLVPKSAD